MTMYLTDYVKALTDCKSGDRIKSAEKNEERLRLVHNLHRWSHYVLWMSDGVESIALSSNFSLAYVSESRVILEKPDALVITSGVNQGDLVCTGKRVAGAVSYFFEYSTDENSDGWDRIPSTRVKYVIRSLQRGVLYYCRIGAVGGYNQVVYSDVTCRTAA